MIANDCIINTNDHLLLIKTENFHPGLNAYDHDRILKNDRVLCMIKQNSDCWLSTNSDSDSDADSDKLSVGLNYIIIK